MADDFPRQFPLFPIQQGQKTSDDYYTPKHVFDLLGLRFDLDVCAPPGGVPWVPADRYLTMEEDGLSSPWEGRVWMNPPYSQATAWVRRFIEHRHGIALLGHAKSAWHPTLWAAADAVAFPFKYFDFIGGSIMLPVWFAAFGEECVEALHRVGVVRLRAAHIDGRIAESSASPPGSQASQQNTEPSIRRDANASDAEAGLGSTGPGEDPSRAGRAGTPPPAHRDGSDDA